MQSAATLAWLGPARRGVRTGDRAALHPMDQHDRNDRPIDPNQRQASASALRMLYRSMKMIRQYASDMTIRVRLNAADIAYGFRREELRVRVGHDPGD